MRLPKSWCQLATDISSLFVKEFNERILPLHSRRILIEGRHLKWDKGALKLVGFSGIFGDIVGSLGDWQD